MKFHLYANISYFFLERLIFDGLGHYQIIAEELKCKVEEIVDFELNVCDTQPSCIGGARKEFIFSGRLDNLASSYCALRALLDTCSDTASLAEESCIRGVALFDNEEVKF